MTNVLVVGARPNSVGATVASLLMQEDYDVTTAGVHGENIEIDVRLRRDIRKQLALADSPIYDHVICTVGINEETDLGGQWDGFAGSLDKHWEINCLGPMALFNAWLTNTPADANRDRVRHFVVMSSNSATVPRSKSMGYCASKAALSQTVRCAGRWLDASHAYRNVVIYAYEPGWISDTPMSKEVTKRLGRISAPAMRGGHQMSVFDLARLMLTNLQLVEPHVLQGQCIRLDGGEQ